MAGIVGIDLGTTNSALAHIDPERSARVVSDEIVQLVGPGELLPRPTLPSFLYLAGEHELPPESLALPWAEGAARDRIVGELARVQGTQVPGRLVASAKSWLCHPHVDRLAPILPWGESAVEGRRISPVEASASYLRHLAGFWRQSSGTALADEEVILCVPASFDEVARELTVRAAAEAGLLRITLLEEPQAAFYAWLADHSDGAELGVGDTVLVCDIGGGTTDFSLITVKAGESGAPAFERTAVGDHLLLGGDNMDLALARRVESRMGRGGRLDPHAFQQLTQACRVGKERLLGEEARSSWTVTVAGRGSKLIGGSLRDEIGRAEAEELVLDGFFPRVAAEAAPERRRVGIQEFGLPYAADPAITRHLAAFLRLHRARPTAVLWNGGVLKSAAIRARILEVLTGWLGEAPRVLRNDAPDLAVARGAAYFGLARRGTGLRIRGGAARAYYLGVDTADVRPGQLTVLCLTPRGLEEGAEVRLGEHALELLTNRPVRFRLFSSSDRVGDRAGQLLTLLPDALAELPPMYTVLRFARSSHETALSVNLHARLTEIGTLEIECVARATGNEEDDRWKLAFDLRAPEKRDEAGAQPSVAPAHTSPEEVDAPKIEAALGVLRALYGREPSTAVDPPRVMKQLQAILGPKDGWSFTVLRALWEPLKELRGGRGKSPQHEARWMNLVGYTLRPGFGYPLDDWRVKETWRLFNAGLVHDKDDPCKLEWWILWRRVSGGLTRTQQDEIFKRVAPHFLPSFAKKAERKSPGPQEAAEMWRCVASMERIPAKQKAELGDVLLATIEKRKMGAEGLWALERLGARVPLYGPVEGVVPKARAEKWVERLMAMEWKGEAHALAAAEMARASGDRARDLDEALRRRLAERLKSAPDGERLARVVLEPTAREAREERLAFGDSLPSGLRLVAEG
jgi:molecular chaperone DnaK (HSP70)